LNLPNVHRHVLDTFYGAKMLRTNAVKWGTNVKHSGRNTRFITLALRFRGINAMMKVSGGWAKGMVLKAPDGESTRPTGAKVREAVMSMLCERLADAVFVDLFAGSGAMGIEALSRGATSCLFIESSRKAGHALMANVAELKSRAGRQGIALGRVEVRIGDVKDVGKHLAGFRPDIVWADPPYSGAAGWFPLITAELTPKVDPGALFVMESDLGDDGMAALQLGEGWTIGRSRRYGKTSIHVAERG
jgi:16S rRNA (guanine966-N2)-methyltransferase